MYNVKMNFSSLPSDSVRQVQVKKLCEAGTLTGGNP